MNYNWKDKTILIAEDEEDNMEFLCAILERTDVKILKAKNGNEVLDIYSKPQNNIDLILMDIKMPGMDGMEASRNLRNMNYDVPIIAQTAYALAGDRERVLRAGCNGYISKPIDTDSLLHLISEYF